MPPVQHRFAKITKTGEAVCIADVSKHDGPFQCLDTSCGQELIAHKGDVNAHYFAHKPDSKCTLSGKNGGGGGESSEHLYCKIWVAKHLSRCRFHKPCETCGHPPHNATKPPLHEKTHVETEFKIGSYIVDIAVVDDVTQAAVAVVEIFHTHATDAKKFEELYKTVDRAHVHEVKTDELLPLIESIGRNEPIADLTITECLTRPRAECTTCRLDLVHRIDEPDADHKHSSAASTSGGGRSKALYGQTKSRYQPPCGCCGNQTGTIRVPCAPFQPSAKSTRKRHYRLSCLGCSKLCDLCKENYLDIISQGTKCYRCTTILAKEAEAVRLKPGGKRLAENDVPTTGSAKLVKLNDTTRTAIVPTVTANK